MPSFEDAAESRLEGSDRTGLERGQGLSLALASLQNDPAFQPVALLTTITGDYDRISMHGVRRSVLNAQVTELRSASGRSHHTTRGE